MAAVRDIITHVSIETASGKRICHRNRQGHEITKGQKCLAIREQNGGRKNYCLPCALEIVTKAKARLQVMEQEIQN